MTDNPSAGYRKLQPGDHPGRYEIEAQLWRDDPRIVAEYYDGPVGVGETAEVTIEATKPDARITLRLTIGFVPADGAKDSLDYVCPDLNTVRTNLAATLIWLAGCDSYGGGLRECENLIGTETAPVQMISDGLWGVIYEVDVDVKAIRARVEVHQPGIAGKFMVTAKWCATCDISDRDWLHARERMQVLVKPPGKLEIQWQQGEQ